MSILIVLSNHVFATSILKIHLDDMLSKSELVFEGEVLSLESRWNTKKTFIRTYINFRIDDVIKGNYSSQTITLSFAGGEVDEMSLQVSGMEYPSVGEKGVFFVEQLNTPQVNPLIGWSQGHFRISKDLSGTERVLSENRKPILGLQQFQPQSSQARSANVRTWTPFSEGVAEGLKLGQDNEPMSNAMDKRAFISSLKQRMERLKSRGSVE